MVFVFVSLTYLPPGDKSALTVELTRRREMLLLNAKWGFLDLMFVSVRFHNNTPARSLKSMIIHLEQIIVQ